MSIVEYHVPEVTVTPTVIFTDAAVQHVIKYLTKLNRRWMRLSVKKTGCSGLSYVVKDVDAPNPTDLMKVLADGYSLCVDASSYVYLKGVCVDYVQQGLNGKFVFENPNQTGQCGCGESFTIQNIS